MLWWRRTLVHFIFIWQEREWQMLSEWQAINLISDTLKDSRKAIAAQRSNAERSVANEAAQRLSARKKIYYSFPAEIIRTREPIKYSSQNILIFTVKIDQ